ncbi:hypothetical protein ARMGADRAFT_882685, partial [Armillaria gallica]
GPSIPWRDREDVYPRYCCLMLILFKPWNKVEDLRWPGQTWDDAFCEFMSTAPERVHKVVNSMQILHECRDSRND